ncbi:MAG: hypothetical protein ACKVT2_08010 [Saprospiraceae bacterium]
MRTKNTTGSLGQAGVFERFRSGLSALMASFDILKLEEQAAILTLPLLMLYVQAKWYVEIPVVALCVMGLIFHTIRHSAYFWFALVCFMAAGIYFSWEVSDNHKYAICYWCLSIFFIKWMKAGEAELRTSARLLLGFIFAFAVGWKLASPDFMNGDFFQYNFLFDKRFSGKFELIGLLDPQILEKDLIAQKALINYGSNLSTVNILKPEGWQTMAVALAWWTIFLEGLIALCFLLPERIRLAGMGDYLLMIFIASTYVVAPVIGFGWLLITMGVIGCKPERRKTRFLYLAVLLLLLLFRLPWVRVVDSFSRPGQGIEIAISLFK